MAGLLVSVRSAAEAVAALQGGASVIDVKEPDRGPLGRADPAVVRAVWTVVPAGVPVSVALGELIEPGAPPADGAGIAFCKLGLAGSGPDWLPRWLAYRRATGPGPGWIAVAYADWETAAAPAPDAVLDAALATGCAGILLDTWSKDRPGPVDGSWSDWIVRARRGGLLVALAGGLDAAAIRRLALLRPDLFAVRGAACSGGDRRAPIDPDRVAQLVRAACPVQSPIPDPGGSGDCPAMTASQIASAIRSQAAAVKWK
jgi:uncharacterized protein (UPF0264 family)